MFGFKSFLRVGASGDNTLSGLIKGGYELLNFTNTFNQDVDETGKILSDVKGGTISVLVDGFPSRELIDWGMEHRIYHDGEIVVLDVNGGVLEKISFETGACTYFQIHYTNLGKAYCATKMEIEADIIRLGAQIEMDKSWTIKK